MQIFSSGNHWDIEKNVLVLLHEQGYTLYKYVVSMKFLALEKKGKKSFPMQTLSVITLGFTLNRDFLFLNKLTGFGFIKNMPFLVHY